MTKGKGKAKARAVKSKPGAAIAQASTPSEINDMLTKDFLDNLPPNCRKRVDALKQIQGESEELHKKFLKERNALEANYQKIHEALYKKRCEIVNGETEVEDLPDKDDKNIGIPNFWLIAMKNNLFLNLEISEKDEGALEYLLDIKCRRIDGPNNLRTFVLEFYFYHNPYFKNDILFKTYILEGDELQDGFFLKKAIGTEINWHAGKRLTQPKEESSSSNPITQTEDSRSFFDFFKTSKNVDDVEKMQDEDLSRSLMDEMRNDYDIGKVIRDKLVPNAVLWYTAEACVDKKEDDGEGEGFGEGEDEGFGGRLGDGDGDGGGGGGGDGVGGGASDGGGGGGGNGDDDDDGNGDKQEDDHDDTDTRQKKRMRN